MSKFCPWVPKDSRDFCGSVEYYQHTFWCKKPCGLIGMFCVCIYWNFYIWGHTFFDTAVISYAHFNFAVLRFYAFFGLFLTDKCPSLAIWLSKLLYVYWSLYKVFVHFKTPVKHQFVLTDITLSSQIWWYNLYCTFDCGTSFMLGGEGVHRSAKRQLSSGTTKQSKPIQSVQWTECLTKMASPSPALS